MLPLEQLKQIFSFSHSIKRNKNKQAFLPFDETLNNNYSLFRQKARNFWYRHAQQQYYSVEIQCLENNRPIPAKSPLRQLNPFLEDGILRVGGRLQESDLTYERKHPIILPKKSNITWAIAVNAHHSINHFSKHALYSRLRLDYYILQGSL